MKGMQNSSICVTRQNNAGYSYMPLENIKIGFSALFSEGAKSLFLIFSQHEICFFLVKIVHFGWPQTNFSGFKKWQAKKKKKVLCLFSSFFTSIFNFPPLRIFLLFLSIFHSSLPLFPGRSAKSSQWKMSGGTLPPHLLHHWLVSKSLWHLVKFKLWTDMKIQGTTISRFSIKNKVFNFFEQLLGYEWMPWWSGFQTAVWKLPGGGGTQIL